jgi:type II secretory pathway component PulC
VGFRRGDVLLSVNEQKIAKTRDVERIAQSGSRVWRVVILRGGQQISAVFGG